MAQRLRPFAALLENPSLVHSVHVGLLTNTHNSSSRGPYTLFWPLRTPARTCAQVRIPHTHTLLEIKINLKGRGMEFAFISGGCWSWRELSRVQGPSWVHSECPLDHGCKISKHHFKINGAYCAGFVMKWPQDSQHFRNPPMGPCSLDKA